MKIKCLLFLYSKKVWNIATKELQNLYCIHIIQGDAKISLKFVQIVRVK